jgi:hypothetical protein
LTAGRRKPHVNDDDNILQLILVNCEDPKSSFFSPFDGHLYWKKLIKLLAFPK